MGIMLRQQFLLGVVPNVFAMFMATLVFRGRLKVTRPVIAGTAGWLFFAFANLFTHMVILEMMRSMVILSIHFGDSGSRSPGNAERESLKFLEITYSFCCW